MFFSERKITKLMCQSENMKMNTSEIRMNTNCLIGLNPGYKMVLVFF